MLFETRHSHPVHRLALISKILVCNTFVYRLEISILYFFQIGFEIFIPTSDQRKFLLPRINTKLKTQFGSSQILIDKSSNSYANLPMMFIDTKSSSTTTKSLILVEQSSNISSIQTANVTVIFNHRVSK